MGRVIAVSNQKGGVAKTTTVINLGASLAVAERRVLVVDADPQANLTSGLGLRSEQARKTLYDVLLDGVPLADTLLETGLPGLRLAPADRHLTGAEIELVSHDARDTRLRAALDPLREEFDYVLIDSPPSLGLLTVNALTAADHVLIPLQAEYFALEGVAELVGTIRRLQAGPNASLDILGVALTMVDERTNLSLQVREEVRAHFGGLVFETEVPRNVRLAEAPSFGKPVLLYDVRSRGAKAYLALAQEVLSHEKTRPREGAVRAAAGG